MDHKISVKQILVDLIKIMPQIEKEFKNNEKYSKLVEFLIEKDYYNDKESTYPTLKTIESQTGLKSHYIRKQLEDMYECLFDHEYDYIFDFNEIEVMINVEYLKRYTSVKCKNIKYLPKIGENITLSFLKARIGIDFFYVQDIRHRFESNKQIIDLFLKGGIYNSYWYYRKHKALELVEIDYGDVLKLNDNQLKRKIGLR